MSRHKQGSKNSASRNIRLADQIQKDLASLIQKELSVSNAGLITLSKVDLSADYAHAKVYFTVVGAEPETAQRLLNEKAGYLHSLLFKMLHIHTVPTLKFLHDENLLHGLHMNKLIDAAVSDSQDPEPPEEEGDLSQTPVKG